VGSGSERGAGRWNQAGGRNEGVMTEDSPITQFLAAADRLDLDGTTSLLSPNARLLTPDGRQVEGSDSIRGLLSALFSELRSMTHEVQAQWHVEDVWIAEASASYELRDWHRFDGLPRAVICHLGDGGVVDLRVYGASEQPLSVHPSSDEPTRVGGRLIFPL
jgi:hypothetical protein